LCFRNLHIIKEILHFEEPIKEILNMEMTIETLKVNLDSKVVGVFLLLPTPLPPFSKSSSSSLLENSLKAVPPSRFRP
jgi:hypothetical protein